jgi:hypothetical protein
VPLMILTDNAVVEKDNGWFKLNEDYGASEARDRLAEAFNRGLSFTWWASEHPEDFKTRAMPSVNDVLGFRVADRDLLTRSQRQQVSDYILNRFEDAVKEARENDSSLILKLPDKNKVEFNVTKDILIMESVLNKNVTPIWPEILDGMEYNKNIRHVTSKKDGSFVNLFIEQPHFMPARDPFRSVGGVMTAFMRYFFGSGYYQFSVTVEPRNGEQDDMTGVILKSLCRDGSIPDEISSFYSRTVVIADCGYLNPPTNDCAVNFGK